MKAQSNGIKEVQRAFDQRKTGEEAAIEEAKQRIFGV